jgi:signal transduction histidine kinase
MSDTQTLVQLKQQLAQLHLSQRLVAELGNFLELKRLAHAFVVFLTQHLPCARAAVFTVEVDVQRLMLVTANDAPPQAFTIQLNLYNTEYDSVLGRWQRGECVDAVDVLDSPFQRFANALQVDDYYTVPLMLREQLLGVLLVAGFDVAHKPTVEKLSATFTILLQNAIVYSNTAEHLSSAVYEMTLLEQMNTEINDQTSADTIFNIILNWAMQHTGAKYALIALYQDRQLVVAGQFGYPLSHDKIGLLLNGDSPELRITRTGRAEVIPDVALDPDFIALAPSTHAKMVVPVLQDQQVIAVISLESDDYNAFNDQHLSFVEKIAQNAAVALQNGQMYQRALQMQDQLKMILNHVVDVVLVVDAQDRVTLINQAAISALGLYTNLDYAGRKFKDVFEHHSEILMLFEAAKAFGDILTREAKLRNSTLYHANVLPQAQGGWVMALTDISAFKRLDQLQHSLLSSISHDLKQPMQKVNGYLDLLSIHRQMDDKGLEYLQAIEHGVADMDLLIDDLLELAQLEYQTQLQLELIELRPLLQRCIDALDEAANATSLTIHNQIAPETQPVWGDANRLQQALQHILANAVKYSRPEGMIHINAAQRGTLICITIQDQGIGIAPQDQPRIFERFYRVRRSETDSISGSGLGLPIAKVLIEAHGGKITLESRLNEGTTFYITLPLQAN